ncbi:MAG: ABC transporter ATP-binding protein [Treponema sp.]|nr:ABC transporter ATP-binding protein [Candidatus Treponema merdequi]
MIEVKNLNAAFGKKIIFENAGFRINDGAVNENNFSDNAIHTNEKINSSNFIALVGPNGAGKSTLLSLLDGIISDGLSVTGQISIDEKPVLEIPFEKKVQERNKFHSKKTLRSEIARKISYLIQNEYPVWNLNVNDFVKTGLYVFDELSENEKLERVKSVLKLLNIEELSGKKIFNISGGEFQKVRLARTLAAGNEYLLLDEPAENLDIAFQSEFFVQLKKIAGITSDCGISKDAGITSDDGNSKDASTMSDDGFVNDVRIVKNAGRANSTRTIIFSIHDINLASNFADRFLLIADKKIQILNRDQLFTEKVIESAWHKKCRIFEHPVTKKPQVLFLD